MSVCLEHPTAAAISEAADALKNDAEKKNEANGSKV
jgi:hypothetical protein